MITFSPDDYVIEPVNVQTLKCVRTINIANAPRQEVLPPPDGASGDYGTTNTFAENYVIIHSTGMTGDIVLEEGYNCSLSTRHNIIQISAATGAGTSIYGSQPAEIAVTPEEEELESQGKYLSRGPRCRELVGTINGLYGPAISFNVGDGIVAETGAGFIKLHLTETANNKECNIPTCVSAINSQGD